MKRRLGCDVDLTVVDTGTAWRCWLDEQSDWSGLHIPKDSPEYNLGVYYPTVADPMDFWRELDYSALTPLPGAMEALEKLSKYFEIVFISANKGTHGKSKYYWLQDHFPFMTGFLATKEKFLMNEGVVGMIDDRLSMLKGFDFNKRILFNTPYRQDVECKVNMTLDGWNDEAVKEVCFNYL